MGLRWALIIIQNRNVKLTQRIIYRSHAPRGNGEYRILAFLYIIKNKCGIAYFFGTKLRAKVAQKLFQYELFIATNVLDRRGYVKRPLDF